MLKFNSQSIVYSLSNRTSLRTGAMITVKLPDTSNGPDHHLRPILYIQGSRKFRVIPTPLCTVRDSVKPAASRKSRFCKQLKKYYVFELSVASIPELSDGDEGNLWFY